MHEHQPDGHDRGDGAVKELEIVARYSSETQAQRAEDTIHNQAKSRASKRRLHLSKRP